MTVHASAGTCLSVSVAAPATQTSVGFAALTWTTVGELESVGDVAMTRAAVTFANMCTAKTTTLKGVEEGITIPIAVALDRDDAGQALMNTAYASNTQVLSVRVTEANGDILYMRAFVMGKSIVYGGVTDVKKCNYSLGVVAPTTGDTIVEFNAV